uniref:NADH-ubiquinone oxidoreductase chain 1 n=1 Tax=Orussus occidentalis TaxID=576952 RepID=C4NCF5_ORUOC|nr:NADH dehydrogenase subunit 1 [Orussus occidentalis]ACJ69706.1 NADH dehydrogenase subunit 1 [Orussus occidentalis]
MSYNLILILSMMVTYVEVVLGVMISLAFFTLLERSVLGLIQARKGPNKVGMVGIIQPMSDAIKLFSSENFNILQSNYYLYLMSPVMSLIVMLIIWISMPLKFNMMNMSLGVLFFLCISSISVYFLMMMGWSSNSVYSLLGSLRSISQTISYEVGMFMMILMIIMITESYSFFDMYIYQKNIWFVFIFYPLFIMLTITMLAELNRTPFDFSEGESELVSGFNVEYMSGSFAMIFMSEYGMILFMSFVLGMVFFGADFFFFFFYIKVVILGYMFIWVRGTFSRFRYDKLMCLAWMWFLPLVMFMISIGLGILIWL